MVHLMNRINAETPKIGYYVAVLYAGGVVRRDPDSRDDRGIRWGIAKLMATREGDSNAGEVIKSRLVWQDDGGRRYEFGDVAAWTLLPHTHKGEGFARRFSFVVPDGLTCEGCFALHSTAVPDEGLADWCRFFHAELKQGKCEKCMEVCGDA